MKIKIKKNQIGNRLDKFLGDHLKDLSRSQAQKIIKQGLVLVNEKIASPHYSLKENDLVFVLNSKSVSQEPTKPIPSFKKFTINDIGIIKETAEFVIINKPAGLAVHGGEGVRGVTLVDLLLDKNPDLKKIGEDPARPGIVHRIDKEVSGLMVIPKTQDSFDNIKKQFQNRTVDKNYLALVYGAVSKEEDEINFPLKRSSSSFKMAALPVSDRKEFNADKEGVKKAITTFEVEKRFINYTLLRVKIKTGRTHQIRVHMLAYGHPIVGDNLYSTARTREKNKKISLGRIFLVAVRLGFKDLSGKQNIFEIGLSDQLQKILEKVK